jgi:2-iminoacetate synthase ThiH
MLPEELEKMIRKVGRTPRRRTTLYDTLERAFTGD